MKNVFVITKQTIKKFGIRKTININVLQKHISFLNTLENNFLIQTYYKSVKKLSKEEKIKYLNY